MATDAQSKLAAQVTNAANLAISAKGFATPIDVLVGLGWLTQAHVAQWRQGQIPYLEKVTTANLSRLSRAMAVFRRWAHETGKRPSPTGYKHRSYTLRFSKSGDPKIEEAYRTHFLCSRKFPLAPSASLPAKAQTTNRREQVHERGAHQPNLRSPE